MTIADVAKEAGVSPATVSRVVNDAGYPVRPETRDRVLAAIDKLEFRPNELARGLLLGRTRTVGLVIPDIANPYYPAVSRGVEDVASASGYAVIFCNTDRDSDKSDRYIQTLLQKQVDGIVVAGGGTDLSRASSSFERYGTKVVFIGRPKLPWASVQIANAEGAAKAMAHLAGLGHGRVAFLSGPRRLTSVRDRLDAYARAVSEHGLDADDALVREGDFGETSGYEEATALLRLRRPPTAIFAANDRMAMGALAAASDHGRAVPEDVSVVGFDDVPMASFVRPALTTVALPTYDMGVAAMRLLLELMERGDGGAPADPPVRSLPVELVVRDSTAPPVGAARRGTPPGGANPDRTPAGGAAPPTTNGKEHDR